MRRWRGTAHAKASSGSAVQALAPGSITGSPAWWCRHSGAHGTRPHIRARVKIGRTACRWWAKRRGHHSAGATGNASTRCVPGCRSLLVGDPHSRATAAASTSGQGRMRVRGQVRGSATCGVRRSGHLLGAPSRLCRGCRPDICRCACPRLCTKRLRGLLAQLRRTGAKKTSHRAAIQ